MGAIPRQPRLDTPNTLHHVMVRGLERCGLLRDDTDPPDFVTRLAGVAESGVLGGFGRRLAPVLGEAPQSVNRAAVRGAARAADWAPFLKR